ncbi:translation initiation factor IF-2 [Corvus cornix cornix]|uniref:translation initiation factor IF-2 n=1 Tax=Corvus cornix cornix TaxID=932674 RepID=UPI0019519801|nr:translation initiation factor IF-2 [Corvus cornix cornix]
MPALQHHCPSCLLSGTEGAEVSYTHDRKPVHLSWTTTTKSTAHPPISSCPAHRIPPALSAPAAQALPGRGSASPGHATACPPAAGGGIPAPFRYVRTGETPAGRQPPFSAALRLRAGRALLPPTREHPERSVPSRAEPNLGALCPAEPSLGAPCPAAPCPAEPILGAPCPAAQCPAEPILGAPCPAAPCSAEPILGAPCPAEPGPAAARMPGRTLRKAAPPAAPAGREAAAEECALELARIGDRWDLRQRILNLLAKLFCPGTWAAHGHAEGNGGESWLCGFGRRGSTDSGR